MTGEIPRWACAVDWTLCGVERRICTAAVAILKVVVGVALLVPPLTLGVLLLADVAALVPALPAAVPALSVITPFVTGDPFLDLLVLAFFGVCIVIEILVALEWRFGPGWRERCQAARRRGSR